MTREFRPSIIVFEGDDYEKPVTCNTPEERALAFTEWALDAGACSLYIPAEGIGGR